MPFQNVSKGVAAPGAKPKVSLPEEGLAGSPSTGKSNCPLSKLVKLPGLVAPSKSNQGTETPTRLVALPVNRIETELVNKIGSLFTPST